MLTTSCTPPVTLQESVDRNVTSESVNQVIAYVPAGMTSPFYSQAAQGVAEYSSQHQFVMEAQAPPAETDFNCQIVIFDNYVKRGVAGILFCSIDSKVLISSIEKANESHIPLVIFNSLSPYEGGNIDGYVGYNQYKAGYSAGKYAANLLGGEGSILVVRGVPGFHDSLRIKGFNEALKDYRNIKVVGETVGNWVRDKSIEVTTEAFEVLPEVELVFGVNDEMAIGASIAAKRMDKTVYTIGIDGNGVSIEEIEKGRLTATIATFPEKIGEISMQQLKKVIDGEQISKFLETPTVLVDIHNLEQFRSGKLWTEPFESEPEKVERRIIVN